MYSQFVSQLDQICPPSVRKPILLAVSGGRDSVVLTHLMSRSGRSFAIAHCNFNLRPGDCDRDEAFVRHMADQFGVPFHVARFDTKDYSAAHHCSIEVAARELRYSFFAELIADYGYSGVATGHHFDDSIETFFLNLLRGTGISGLHGIRPYSERLVETARGEAVLAVFRPLLAFSRRQIDEYVAQHDLTFVEDYTNASIDYRRNQIRHQLLPLLRELSPQLDQSMATTISALSDAEELFREQLRLLSDRHLHHDGEKVSITYDSLRMLHPQATVLFEFLKPYGFKFSQVESILSDLNRQTGSRFLSPTHQLVFDREGLVIAPLVADAVMPPVLQEEVLDITQVGNLRVPSSQIILDYDKVSFPLSLRHPQEGDRFQPFGMKGASQLLSDFFKDHHLNAFDKASQYLLVDAQDRILWLVGRRASQVCAVTSETKKVLRISLCE